MLQSLDLTIPCAIVNAVGAFACLFLMQALTGDCGLRTKAQRIKLLHRVSFVGLAAALFYSAGVTIDDDSAPRLVDFLVQLAALPVIAVSAWRHHIGAVAQVTRTREALGRAAPAAGRPVPNPFPTHPYTQFDCDWVAPDRSHQEKIQ